MTATGRPKAYDPAVDSAILLGTGSAHSVAGADEVRGRLAGHIVIPDIEERHGWREWYVYQSTPEAPTRRPLGFERP